MSGFSRSPHALSKHAVPVPDSVLSPFRTRAQELTDRAYVPFSEHPTAALAVLEDGSWIPGVRVESASFSLTIPALLNAYTTAVALECADDIAAFLLSRPFRREESVYVEELPDGPYAPRCADAYVRSPFGDNGRPAPIPSHAVDPFLPSDASSVAEHIRAARTVANRAYVPSSTFPVGALLQTEAGDLIPGVNVEHPDWARILCAERSALGTLLSYDAGRPSRLFLSCSVDPEGTPCGACRQLLAELAPDSILWMDRHDEAPEEATPSSLLPGSFRGRALLNS